jgi:hypothetical protein
MGRGQAGHDTSAAPTAATRSSRQAAGVVGGPGPMDSLTRSQQETVERVIRDLRANHLAIHTVDGRPVFDRAIVGAPEDLTDRLLTMNVVRRPLGDVGPWIVAAPELEDRRPIVRPGRTVFCPYCERAAKIVASEHGGSGFTCVDSRCPGGRMFLRTRQLPPLAGRHVTAATPVEQIASVGDIRIDVAWPDRDRWNTGQDVPAVLLHVAGQNMNLKMFQIQTLRQQLTDAARLAENMPAQPNTDLTETVVADGQNGPRVSVRRRRPAEQSGAAARVQVQGASLDADDTRALQQALKQAARHIQDATDSNRLPWE